MVASNGLANTPLAPARGKHGVVTTISGASRMLVRASEPISFTVARDGSQKLAGAERGINAPIWFPTTLTPARSRLRLRSLHKATFGTLIC